MIDIINSTFDIKDILRMVKGCEIEIDTAYEMIIEYLEKNGVEIDYDYEGYLEDSEDE